jgi:hypothetical protein
MACPQRTGRSQRTCFLIFMTLKRSKSFSPRLLVTAARFLAHALSSNFCSTLCSSHFFATWPTPLWRASLGMTMGVRESFASAICWRATGAFSEGPSMRTYVCVSCRTATKSRRVRTRLWSMISTIVANRPSYRPSLKRTTRPTSTCLQALVVISASPISSICAASGD